MFNELALKIEELLGQGSDFAIAQVVDRIAPSSGKVGDKALILETGELIGWIGGGCGRGIVIKEALSVIKNKRHRSNWRLLQILKFQLWPRVRMFKCFQALMK